VTPTKEKKMTDFERPVTRTQSLIINGTEVGASAAEMNKSSDLSSNTAEYTESGAIPATVQNIELNHATVAAEMTIADLADHQGMVTIKNTSASGTVSHTITLAAGTFNGSNDVVTLDAGGEFIAIWVDSSGNGSVIENVGSVALSTAA